MSAQESAGHPGFGPTPAEQSPALTVAFTGLPLSGQQAPPPTPSDRAADYKRLKSWPTQPAPDAAGAGFPAIPIA